MINCKIAPVIPRIGSLGASGDLATLSHLALAMMGEGKCNTLVDGEWIEKDVKEILIENNLNQLNFMQKRVFL